MNKNKYLLVFILLLCLIPNVAKATDWCVINGTTVRVRDAASTSGNKLGTYNTGDKFVLKTRQIFADKGGGCESGYWYQIDHNGATGYVCTAFAIIESDTPVVITDEAKTQCESELKSKGFPQVYWNALCNLKAKYPNWEFNAIDTLIDFPSAVAGESCKGSIRASETNINKGFTDSTCGKKYDTGYTGASSTATAYYMNPLNFLNEKNIFMFESNYTNNNLLGYYVNASKSIISPSTYFVQFIPNVYTYIANASNASNVAASAISARIKQEMGSGDLGKTVAPDNTRLFSCLSGNYSTRYPNTVASIGDVNNYYNFFNIAATDGSDVTQKALIYARNHGWGGTGNQDNDRQTAVTGGAQWIYKWYINAGQQTIYFNKFNVNPKSSSSKFSHQYMTNVDAPSSESILVYNGYSSSGALSANHIFYIPVYSNLDASINNTPGGATGDTNNSNTGLQPSTMVVSAGLNISGSAVFGIKSNTSIVDLKGRIQSQGGTINIYSGNNLINDGIVGTGMVMKIASSTGNAEYSIVIKGDTSGDGLVNALDLLQIKKSILGQKKIEGVYYAAADTSSDGTVNALDLLQVKKKILGQKEL